MRLRILTSVIVLFIAVLAVIAWNRNTTRNPAAAGAGGEAAAPSGGAGMPSGAEPAAPAQDPGLAWKTPRRWVQELASGMRLATYVIPAPASGGEAAGCAVYYFGPGQGGGVDANLERWIAEFETPGTPKRTTRDIHGLRVSRVEVTGVYTAHAGGPGEETRGKPGWTLLGAIVDGPAGAVFYKLTGPGPTVAAASKEFDGMLASLRKK